MRIVKEYNSEIQNPKFGWPMLAAQSDFPSEPLPGFIEYSINELGDDPKIITKTKSDWKDLQLLQRRLFLFYFQEQDSNHCRRDNESCKFQIKYSHPLVEY
jgi:hypothetical protein